MSRIRKRGVILISLFLVAVTFAAPAGAHRAGGGHMWNDHFKPRLSNEGTINDPSNPMHWTKLKGVPAGFADGVDAGGGTAEDLDCSTTCVQNAEIESVDSSKVTGTITADDVDCSTTCVQNAEIESVASSKITGAITADDVDCSTACVQSGEIGTGEVRGGAAGLAPVDGHIRNQTITGGTDGNLALDTITADNLTAGSVGASEIAGGAVTPQDMTATWANSTGGFAILDESTPSADLLTAIVDLTDADGQDHAVLLNGGLSASCAPPCTDGVSVVAQLLEDGVEIGQEFSVELDEHAPQVSFPLTFVSSATASDAGTMHTYSIRVETDGPASYGVGVFNAHMSAVDVGRA